MGSPAARNFISGPFGSVIRIVSSIAGINSPAMCAENVWNSRIEHTYAAIEVKRCQ